MKTFSVQQMPHGFEVEAPAFGYWFKAGAAFTLGAGIVTVIAMLAWGLISMSILTAWLSRPIH